VSANQADTNNALSVRGMCRVLQVSPSGYYDWLRRLPSARMLANLVLTEAIRQVHKDSDETYGMPRVRAELREAGHIVSRKRVASLMRKACIRGVSRRRGFTVTTERVGGNAPRRIWSTGDSTPASPISCGWPT
jgi:putative transposase